MEKSKKYMLAKDEFRVEPNGVILYRVKALRDIPNIYRTVKKGEWGGFVQSESNLDQYSDSWIFDDSVAKDNAQIRGRSAITNGSIVCDNSLISNSAILINSFAFGRSSVCGRAKIINSMIGDNATVGGPSWILNSKIFENSALFDIKKIKYATITDCKGQYNDFKGKKSKYILFPDENQSGLYRIMAIRNINNSFQQVKAGELGGLIESPNCLSQYGDSWIFKDAIVYDGATVQDGASVSGNSVIRGNAVICEHAKIDNCDIGGNVIAGGGCTISNYRIENNFRLFGSLRFVNPQKTQHKISSKKSNVINLFSKYDVDKFIDREAELY